MTDKLKPCPFCGGKAMIETCQCAGEETPRYRVGCAHCWCETDWENFCEEDAAEKWNRRATDEDNKRTDC